MILLISKYISFFNFNYNDEIFDIIEMKNVDNKIHEINNLKKNILKDYIKKHLIYPILF